MTKNRLEYILKQMIKKAKLEDPCFVYDKKKYYYNKSNYKKIPIVGMYLLNDSIHLMENPFFKTKTICENYYY